MELGKPIRTVIVEPAVDPKQQTVPKPERETEERECVLPTTPRR
jgi:hypothetical protein